MDEQMFKRDPTTATIGVEILPFEIRYLPDFFQKKGEIEINNTQSVRERSLRELKEALASEDDSVRSVPFSDEALLAHLTCRKFDVSRVVTQIKKFVIFKRKEKNSFIVPSFTVLSRFMTSGFITFLPWRCQDGCGLLLMQLDKYNSVQHPVAALKQLLCLVSIQGLRYPMSQVNGYKVIFDLNITLEILKVSTPQNLYDLYYGTQEVLPGRFKSFHVINMGKAGKPLWQILRCFLSEKLKERVRFHSCHDTLFDYFPRAVLPVKYGGDLKDYDMTDWLRRISSPEELKWITGSIFQFE